MHGSLSPAGPAGIAGRLAMVAIPQKFPTFAGAVNGWPLPPAHLHSLELLSRSPVCADFHVAPAPSAG
jgi:hypothetical protein